MQETKLTYLSNIEIFQDLSTSELAEMDRLREEILEGARAEWRERVEEIETP